MDDGPLTFNGVDPDSGEYLFAPTRDELVGQLRHRFSPDRPLEREIRRLEAEQQAGQRGEPPPGIAPEDLASAGWGVIFASDAEPEVHRALEELLAHRRAQAGERFHAYLGEEGYLPGDSHRSWLRRQGMGPGPVDPRRVPYHLLIVGDPETIPFDFQFELGPRHSVGRLAFDSPEEYVRYARSVVRAETQPPVRSREMILFGAANPDDPPTSYSLRYLVRPLLEALGADPQGFEIGSFLAGEATRERLTELLSGGPATPALLFTSGHGLGPGKREPAAGDGPTRERPGALLCQDWPGPKAWKGAIPAQFYLSARDVRDEADLTGLITFHFACYSAGMPERDSFGHEPGREARVLGPKPVLSPLPQRLLGKEHGAQAVIGHVDRSRGFSFYWPRAGSQPQVFEATLRSLMRGEPVGAAARFLSARYAQISIDLKTELLKQMRGMPVDQDELLDLWTAEVDARSYLVLGDPAARLLGGGS